MGFIRDDKFGTTFVGEGCWGAPIRANNDNKSWTRASGSFNQVNWICVTPEKIFARTILVDSIGKVTGTIDPTDPFGLPEGLEIWQPETGAVVTITPRSEDGRPELVGAFARVKIIAGEKDFEERTLIQLIPEGMNPEDVHEIRFTLDGSEPTSASPVYSGPFEITETTTIRAALFKMPEAVTEPETLTVTRKESK
jgi:hypothetical protein